MWQSHWYEAIDGPQPWCPIDPPEPIDRDSGRASGEDGASHGAAIAGHLTALSLRRAQLATWVPIP